MSDPDGGFGGARLLELLRSLLPYVLLLLAIYVTWRLLTSAE